MVIWFASGNTHKKRELQAILSGDGASASTGIELKIPADIGLAFNPDEIGTSFHENALIKANALFRLLHDTGNFHPGDLVISDDSGLCVDALDGRPGIYSARYRGPPGKEAPAPLDDGEKNLALLGEMSGKTRRGARFVCAMVLLQSEDTFFIAQETLEGRIVDNTEKMRGAGGFGYDPVLFIPEMNCTVAELSEDVKNEISHRGKAAGVIGKILSGILTTNHTNLTNKK